MKFFASIAIAALAVVGVASQALQINTPTNVVECEPQLLSWSGGTAPYFVSILPGGQPSAAALVDFGQQSGTSLTWTVNITSGTSLGLSIRDSTGATESSAPFTVQSGSTSCIGSSGSSTSSAAGGSTTSSSSSAAGGSTTSAASTTAAGTSTATSAKTTATTPSTSSSSSAAASSTTAASSGGVISTKASYGVAALIGAAVMAVIA